MITFKAQLPWTFLVFVILLSLLLSFVIGLLQRNPEKLSVCLNFFSLKKLFFPSECLSHFLFTFGEILMSIYYSIWNFAWNFWNAGRVLLSATVHSSLYYQWFAFDFEDLLCILGQGYIYLYRIVCILFHYVFHGFAFIT